MNTIKKNDLISTYMSNRKKDLSTVITNFLELVSVTFKAQSVYIVKQNIENTDIIFSYPKNTQKMGHDLDFLTYHKNIQKPKTCVENELFYCIIPLSFFGYYFIIVKEQGLTLTEDKLLQNYIHLANKIYALMEKEHIFGETFKQERNMFQNIIDSIPDLIAYKDNNERYIYINKASKEYYNMDLLGKKISEIYPQEDANIVRELDQEVINKKTYVRKKIALYTSRGYIHTDSIRSPVYDDANQIQGIVSIARDISELEKTKETLERNYQFQNILMRLASKFINVDKDDEENPIHEVLRLSGSYIKADRSYVFLYHFENNLIEYAYEWCNEGVSNEIDNFKYLPLDEYIEGWVDKHKNGEGVFIPDIDALNHTSSTYKTLKHQKIKSVIAIPLMYKDKCLGFVGFDDIRDNRIWGDHDKDLLLIIAEIITNLLISRQKELELIKAKEIAELASQEKSDFLAHISHDIHTPLNGILSASYLLKSTELTMTQTEYISIMDSSITSLNSMIRNVLDITKIEAGQFGLTEEVFNLEETVTHIVESLSQFVKNKGIVLNLDFDYRITNYVVFYLSAFYQIMFNLVNNAIKFTTNGHVNISVSLKSTTHKSGKILFSVEDSGIGIKRDDLEKITNKFYRAKDTRKTFNGTGLGLYIVQSLLARLNSSLEIVTERDKGSCFSFILDIPWAERTDLYKAIKDKHFLIVAYNHDIPHAFKTMVESLSTHVTVSPKEYKVTSLHDIVIHCIDSGNSKDVYQFNKTIKKRKPHEMHLIYDFSRNLDMQNLIDEDYDFILRPTVSRYTLNKIYETFVQNLHTTSKTRKASKQKNTILIVEDNFINRETMRKILQQHDYAVHAAESAEAALENLNSFAYSIIILDIQLTGMQGDELTRVIRTSNTPYRNIPIIGVTAHVLTDDIKRNLQDGMNTLFTKPINYKSLLEAINRLTHHTYKSKHEDTPSKHTVFSVEDFEQRFQDYLDIGYETIKTFIETVDPMLADFKNQIETHNPKVIYKGLHFLKGTASHLSATTLYDIIEKEMSIFEQNPSHVPDGTFSSRITSAFHDLILKLKAYLIDKEVKFYE
ncbi:MAG: response regulator [Bacillota bacterium]